MACSRSLVPTLDSGVANKWFMTGNSNNRSDNHLNAGGGGGGGERIGEGGGGRGERQGSCQGFLINEQ